MTLGVATHAPVSGRRSAKRVEPLAAGRTVCQHGSHPPSIRLKVARFQLAYMPKLLVC